MRCRTHQVKVSLEGAELLGAKVLWQDRSGELGYISNTECFSRLRPEDDLRVLWRGFNELALALKHLVEATRELLWHSTLSRSRVMQSGDSTFGW